MKKTYKSLKAFFVLLSMISLKMGALSGVVTINNTAPASSTNFTSFTTFASALNTSGVSGTLVVNVGGTGPYNEQVTFNQITGASATNTITINGNGYTLTFNANSGAPETMWLNGTDYLYVNNLSIAGTNANYAHSLVMTDGADYNMFTSCTFSCPTNGTGYDQIPLMWSYSNLYATNGTGIGAGNYNTIQSCTITGGYYGVFHAGAYSAPYTTNNSLRNCRIREFYETGLYLDYSKNFAVTGCTIDRLTRTNPSSYTNLMYAYNAQGMNFSGNIIEKMFNAAQSSNGYFYMFNSIGSFNPAQGTNPCKIVNNIVRNIEFNGTIYGFYYTYYTDTQILHNTLSFDHTAATGGSTYAFMYTYGGSGMAPVVKNNIVTITRGGSGSKYGFYNGGTSLSGAIVDYNDWYVNSLGGSNYVGYISANATNLMAFQSQGGDANGFSTDPIYTNLATGDLHPTNASVNNTGTPLNVALDNQGAPRSQSNPDIGALEFLSNTCSSTPTNISVWTPTAALCPGKNADINVNGYTSDLGVTYQWLSSTTSSVGPWTVINGANTVLYTTPNLNTTTFYGVSVSCTLVGTTATVANVINIAGTTTSVVPYHESFEGISNVGDLPNCSWFADNQGVTAMTYTGSLNQNRSARTGSKFGAFSTSYVSGTDAFYTNGIQLVAGVTYSASVWYKTDFYGYTNVTDFSMNYGTTQSQTGLTTIASTGGPASSGIYTPLSNTFQVATSGLYYVSVQVTTNGSYGTYYLSWDDLDIIIPCSLNTTSVTVSTSTNVICSGQGVDLSAVGADDYVWNNGATGSNITEFPNQNTQYFVVATNTLSGCSQTVNAQYINVLTSPDVFVIGNKNICLCG